MVPETALKPLNVRSAELMPVPPTNELMVFKPCPTVKVPTVSADWVCCRPCRANVPPLKDVLTRSQTADQRSKEAEVAAKAALQALNLTKRSLSERRAEAGRLKTSKADIERNLRDLGVNQEMLDEWAPHRMDEKTKQTKAPWHDEASKGFQL